MGIKFTHLHVIVLWLQDFSSLRNHVLGRVYSSNTHITEGPVPRVIVKKVNVSRCHDAFQFCAKFAALSDGDARETTLLL